MATLAHCIEMKIQLEVLQEGKKIENVHTHTHTHTHTYMHTHTHRLHFLLFCLVLFGPRHLESPNLPLPLPPPHTTPPPPPPPLLRCTRATSHRNQLTFGVCLTLVEEGVVLSSNDCLPNGSRIRKCSKKM